MDTTFKEWVLKAHLKKLAKVNQQPPMHQLAVLSTGWAAFFHTTSSGVHHNPFLFAIANFFFFHVCSQMFFP